jgi:hypothetical protein
MVAEDTRGARRVQPLPLQHRVRHLGHVAPHLQHPELAQPVPAADHERLDHVLVGESLPRRRPVEEARHAREGVRRLPEQREPLVRRRQGLQPLRHTVAIEDLAVARPRGLGEADRSRRRDVEETRKRARQGEHEEGPELVRLFASAGTTKRAEPIHARILGTEFKRWM